MTDLEVIHEFYEQISWQDECQEVEENNRTFIKTDKILMLPSHYEQLAENITAVLGFIEKYPNCEPALIIWGNPDTQTANQCIERCFFGSRVIHPDFIDVTGRFAYTHYLTKALDGIDWGRSLTNLYSGDGTPVFEWDK